MFLSKDLNSNYNIIYYMKKKVVKVGTSLGIVFNRQERDIYNIKHEDIIDIGDLVKVKKKC